MKRILAGALLLLVLLTACTKPAPTPTTTPSQTPIPAPSQSAEPEPSSTTDPAPTQTTEQPGKLAALAVENLDLQAEAGIDLPLVYESDNLIIFWGAFGIFGYDLEKEEITFSVDFKKLYGEDAEPYVQGSVMTSVEATEDGTKLAVHYGNPNQPDVGKEPCYIDLANGTWTFSAEAPAGDTYISFDSETRLGDLIPGGTIGGTTYMRGEKTWKIFQSDKLS